MMLVLLVLLLLFLLLILMVASGILHAFTVIREGACEVDRGLFRAIGPWAL